MKKWRVYYNTHRYIDRSDNPRACSRIVKADTAENALQSVRKMECVGRRQIRWIGLVHCAEPL